MAKELKFSKDARDSVLKALTFSATRSDHLGPKEETLSWIKARARL